MPVDRKKFASQSILYYLCVIPDLRSCTALAGLDQILGL